MVEEIITALSRIRWLFVTARNSSFRYKGQAVDVKRVGRELGVRYVLEGSVRRNVNRVRITAQLIDSGTGAHLWADHFDGPLEDVFDLQDKVASCVAGVIEPTLQEAETARSTGRPTTDLTAYDLYLRAHAMVWSSARQIPKALGLLEQAIARDARYGPALAWAAQCCFWLLSDYRSKDREADRVKGGEFARQALEVAGDDPGILANAAHALAYFGEDIGAMTALVDRALALNPNFARGWHISGALRNWAGQPDIAIEHLESALRLNPRSRIGTSRFAMGVAQFLSRRFDEAVPNLSLAIQEDPSFTEPFRLLAACYAHMGRLNDAREIVERLRAITSVVIPDVSFLRNAEHRELYLSGLRLATGENRSIEAVSRRGDQLVRSSQPPAADKSTPEQSLPVADEPSLAVLPFLNLSGDPEQEYFADGMVEEIITALSRIRWLFVTARNSTFAYKGQNVDIKRVGQELGVRYVLEGSVRKSGDRVRITAQLIDAGTGAHLWADHFDGPLQDVFDLQDKVASSVAGFIEPALQAAETARSTGRPTTDLTAYDLYLRAHAMVWSARQIPAALCLLEQAITRDPRYGPALAWAAMCCYRLCVDGSGTDPEKDSRKGIDFGQQALEVAGDDPVVIVNAALALSYFGEDINAMIALVDRALVLNPNFARGWHVGGILRLFAGQPGLAIKHAETALRLSPRARVGTTLSLMGQALFLARRFDEAVPKLLLAIQEDPSFPAPYRYLAACYAHMGRLGEARAIVDRLRRITSGIGRGDSWFRNAEHRELYLSGLRLASGENRSIDEVHRPGDRMRGSPEPPAADKSAVGRSLPVPDEPSLAVLPFLYLSSDSEQEYFADGITDDIITAMSRYPSLLVIARTSSFTYKGRSVDVKQIGRELGVRYLLEGGLRKAGNRIRVNAQLIETETGNHLWAERYDRDLADIFAVQDEITQAVTIAIAPAIADAELRRAIRKPPDRLDAWLACQCGFWHLGKATPDDNRLAIKFFRQAIDLDPTYSGAIGGLAMVRATAGDFEGRRPSETAEEVEALIRQAVALDPANSEARSTLASILYRRGDFDGGLAEAKTALEMSPNLAHAHGVLGATLVFSGRPKPGVAALEKGVRLDPRGPQRAVRLNQIALGLYFCREYEAAVQMAKQVIREYPEYPQSYRWLAAALGQLGRTDEAKQALEKAIAVAPAVFDIFVRQGVPWIRPEDHTHMLEGLHKAGWRG